MIMCVKRRVKSDISKPGKTFSSQCNKIQYNVEEIEEGEIARTHMQPRGLYK
jgi:hypothetical protein